VDLVLKHLDIQAFKMLLSNFVWRFCNDIPKISLLAAEVLVDITRLALQMQSTGLVHDNTTISITSLYFPLLCEHLRCSLGISNGQKDSPRK
jgi:hypothetical protein